MTTPALVILDMAGTTVEDRGQVPTAFASALAANGITVGADEIARVRGASKRQAIRNLLPPPGDDPVERLTFESQAGLIYRNFQERLMRSYLADGVREVAGASAAIRGLRSRGIKVALTTGFDRDIATLLLTSLGWTGNAVDAVVCGDEVPEGRPAPAMIFVAMQITMIEDPARVANVGDTTLDLESGARAGVRWNIGVLSGAHTREALERTPHTNIIASVAELAEVLGTQ
ncbi:MAG TPA: phosphonatase-like hydrolase [Vicinamibacterales bacterium]|jgi:phosphonatase-like hydrolase